MGKYKRGIVEEIEKSQEIRRNQEELKRKHHIDAAEERIIVEKSNMLKFLIRTAAAGIRIAASIGIAVLAVVGLTGLVYPGPREELNQVGMAILDQLQTLLGI